MPEGDTIHRSARTLGRVLPGAVVTAARSGPRTAVRVGRLAGQTVDAVEARGKHLLIWFGPRELALHTHMRMSGSWHLYREGQAWQRPPPQVTVVLEVPGWTAVCFNAPVCELLGAAQVARHPGLSELGPDAAGDDVDLEEARRRLDARAGWSIADALLDQRVLAGIGNVYKSEVLFLHGVHPSTAVADVEPDLRDALLATAVRLLGANARRAAPRRTTTGSAPSSADGRLFAYGRSGRPCRRCGTPIRAQRQGSQGRLTYWCPTCQPA